MEINPKNLQSNLKPFKPYPSWFFHNRHSCLLKKKKFKNPPLNLKSPTNFGFFPSSCLTVNPPVFKHLNISYTKFGSKWIWFENMVKPTLIKMSI